MQYHVKVQCSVDDCDAEFSSKSNMKKHFHRFHSHRIHKCKYCGLKFEDKFTLLRHQESCRNRTASIIQIKNKRVNRSIKPELSQPKKRRLINTEDYLRKKYCVEKESSKKKSQTSLKKPVNQKEDESIDFLLNLFSIDEDFELLIKE